MKNATTARMTIVSRHARPILITRPSSRSPPSSIEANTIAPKITSSAREIYTARIVSPTTHTHTSARLASKRSAGLLMTVGLARLSSGSAADSACPSAASSISVSAIGLSALPDFGAQTEPSALAAQCPPPGQRVPGRAAVEREGGELRPAADVGDRYRPAETVAAEAAILGAAVGRMVAVVAHQEHVALGHGELVEVVEILQRVVDDQVARPVGQGLAIRRRLVDHGPVGQPPAKLLEYAEARGAVADLVIDRNPHRGFDLLAHGLAVEDDLAVDHRDPVAGQRDDALDVVLVAVGRHGDDDVAVFGRRRRDPPLAARQHVERSRDPAPAIRELAHHQPVAD